MLTLQNVTFFLHFTTMDPYSSNGTFFADFRALSIVNHRGGSGVIYHGALIWDLFEILKCSQHQ